MPWWSQLVTTCCLVTGHVTFSLSLSSEPVRETAPAVRPRLARLAPAVAFFAAVLSHLLLLLRLQGHVGAVAAAHHAAHVVLVVLKAFIGQYDGVYISC